MQIETWEIGRLIPYDTNPRVCPEKAIAKVADSLRLYGWRQAIVVDGDGVIIAGHTRWKAAKLLGLKTVPVHVAKDMDPDDVRAYRITDNRVAEETSWDKDLLALETSALTEAGYDLDGLGFDMGELDALFAGDGEAGDGDGAYDGHQYTKKVSAPIYEPTGEKPEVVSLADRTKTDELLGEIAAAQGLPADVAAFLRMAAERHTVFNFSQIAEFYAHAPAEIQRLMERSALVIIDFEKAIENGFTRLSAGFDDQFRKDYPELPADA